MRFDQMNWTAVEQYLAKDDRLIFITGATEQHSTLSLLTDILIPSALAEAVAKREQVLIAPPLNFGCSPYFTAYPGTISLRLETFVTVVKEVAEQLIGQGFKAILFLNGHGGNPIGGIVADLAAEHPEARLASHNWWQSPRAVKFAEDHQLLQSHANWQENFPFTRLGNAPAGRKQPVTLSSGRSPKQVRALLGDGSFGGDYQVSDDIMQAFMAELVDEITQLVRDLKA
jgi:creatinine amidohydrolase